MTGEQGVLASGGCNSSCGWLTTSMLGVPEGSRWSRLAQHSPGRSPIATWNPIDAANRSRQRL